MSLPSLAKAPVQLTVEIEQWALERPFRIAGYLFDASELVVVTLARDGKVGRGEASGVYYRGDTPVRIVEQIEALRAEIEVGVDRTTLQAMLPPGGARNALDCALWDLEAKLNGNTAAANAGLKATRPLLTTFTCGADSGQAMATAARAYSARYGARAIKLKLIGDSEDNDRIVAVREALPEVWLAVDANQGFSRASLEQLMPTMVSANVALIEQPFPVGDESDLDGLNAPIPIAADESVQTSADIPGLVGRVQAINIKLDKCGGLTEALHMVELARQHGLDLMVGNMTGSSLAMAPSFLVGQRCKIVDLDGPALLRSDRTPGVTYRDGMIHCDQDVWG